MIQFNVRLISVRFAATADPLIEPYSIQKSCWSNAEASSYPDYPLDGCLDIKKGAYNATVCVCHISYCNQANFNAQRLNIGLVLVFIAFVFIFCN